MTRLTTGWILEELKAAEAFDNDHGYAHEKRRGRMTQANDRDGENSPTVAGRLRMSCAGWTKVPSAQEFYQAVHDPTGSERETAILLTWYHEADTLEHAKARLEGAYSWRELVQALHRVGLTRGEGARRLNRFCTR